ncbi:MAG: phage tail spike protein, partial [Paraclostridium sp.]
MQLYDKLGQVKLGDLADTLEAYVEEERNGLFELTFDYPNNYPLSDKLEKECIVMANANDTLRNQKFRIYDTQKFIDGTITVFARHISFDLMYDIVNNVTFTNQSCEYALNQLF